MRALALCLVVVLACGALPARADDAFTPADHQAIERVIASQLDAFRRDAGETAFGFASPKIRSMFGTAPNFMAMVRQGYPPVYRPRSFTFGPLETIDGQIVQHVTIIGPDGAEALAFYAMEQEPDGSWRIDGCALVKPARLDT